MKEEEAREELREGEMGGRERARRIHTKGGKSSG